MVTDSLVFLLGPCLIGVIYLFFIANINFFFITSNNYRQGHVAQYLRALCCPRTSIASLPSAMEVCVAFVTCKKIIFALLFKTTSFYCSARASPQRLPGCITVSIAVRLPIAFLRLHASYLWPEIFVSPLGNFSLKKKLQQIHESHWIRALNTPYTHPPTQKSPA